MSQQPYHLVVEVEVFEPLVVAEGKFWVDESGEVQCFITMLMELASLEFL